ncbi:hypothetical protein CIK05_11775 [Bdellovibrio sp. qaytius]|nr:hypothetical protein CIK05_11775 [Bdellovibrio sp. qaytius]
MNFYVEQFSKMMTVESFIFWILTLICFILDYWLVRKAKLSYLNRSITIFKLPGKLEILDLNKLKAIPEFRLSSNSNNDLFCLPKSFMHFQNFPIIKFKVNETRASEGKIQISLLKIASGVFAILFFYFVFKSNWGKEFEKPFGTFLGISKIFYFMLFGLLMQFAQGTWAVMGILKDARMVR